MKNFILLLVAVFAVLFSSAQSKKPPKKVAPPMAKDDTKPVRYIPLPAKTSFYKPSNFYISGVIDATGTKDTIGVAVKSKTLRQKLVLQGGTVPFFKTVLDSMLARDTTLYPVVMRLTKFSISETRERFQDASEVIFAYEFLSVHKNDTIQVSSYSGGGNFVTYMHFQKNYDSAFTSMQENWNTIEENIGELAERHPAFVKGVVYTVNLRTVSGSEDTVLYPVEELNFSDYRGNPQSQTGISARMFIEYKPELSFRKGYIYIHIDLSTVFNRKRSWLGDDVRMPEVLHHLNYRFRLLHRYTLLLKDKLEKAQPTTENYRELLETLYDEVSGQAMEAADRFADETQYGTKAKAQAKWEEKIDRGLPFD